MAAIFKNRTEAGRALAKALLKYKGQNGLVLALPRGGVPVGYAIAKALAMPLDILIVRKIGLPGHEEFGLGAMAETGAKVFDQKSISDFEVAQAEIDRVVAKESAELARRKLIYRGGRDLPNLSGRLVILTDDGLATGVTVRAAVAAAKELGAAKIVVAVPVCARVPAKLIGPGIDEFVCLKSPVNFLAVGNWYEDFGEVSDAEVQQLLTGDF